jgi:PPOX class probable FMN-dependent enzyme
MGSVDKNVVTGVAAGVATLAGLYAINVLATRNKRGKLVGDPGCRIDSLQKLRDVIPVSEKAGRTLTATKVLTYLDEQMFGFVERSPFVQLGTSSSKGMPFVSPKGDGPGFIKILDNQTLVIPDRPGNNILFGHENILENPQAALIFEIPGNNLTLRVGGYAELTTDPELCKMTNERGRDAIMCIVLHVEYAFFHCAKAYQRSNLWKPDTWPEERFPVSFGPYFSKNKEDLAAYQKYEAEKGDKSITQLEAEWAAKSKK